MLINDLIRYCAKFPPKAKVLAAFRRTLEKVSGYDTLRAYVNALPEEHLLADLDDFILANFDEKKLADKVRSVRGYFLMLEYGIMRATTPGVEGSRRIELRVSVHFGNMSDVRDMDGMEEGLIMDKCQEIAVLFIQNMQTDDALICAQGRLSAGSMTLVPIDPMLLYSAIGWTLTFEIQANALF